MKGTESGKRKSKNMEETYDTYEKILISRAMQKGIPLSVSLELLPLCNMDCRMCYVRLNMDEMKKQGHLRTAKEWLTLARQMRDAGTLFVILTGGEPLLYPAFEEVYRGIKDLGMIITVNTNGTLLDKKWVDFFTANPPRRINITLYGTDKETYKELCGFEDGYERAITAIRSLRHKGISVKINASLVRANNKQIDEIIQVARALDTAVNVDTYMYPAKRERSRPFDAQVRLTPEKAATARFYFFKKMMQEDTFLEFCKQTVKQERTIKQEILENDQARKMHCQAGRTSFAINWQGQMQPCVMLKNPSFPVFEIGIEKAWKQLQKAVDEILLSEDCGICKYRTVCQTCGACALYEGGSFEAVPVYMCRYTSAFCSLCETAINDEKE